jgi:hypothetical protein
MQLKSEMMSNILKILLWPLVALTVTELLSTIIFTIDVTFYMNHVYSFNSFVNLLSFALYYIIIVVYLIWIYRVHMDLKQLFIYYPRSPGSALACMIVPFYSFYGVPSTYRIIGGHFLHQAKGIEKQGKWVHGLAVPLIICIVATNIFNRVIARSTGDTNPALLISSGVVELITYTLFLTLCILVSQGLKQMNLTITASMTDIENDEWSTVNNEAASDSTDGAAL